MGRLGYEMWRACRLVVDTGIHSKGWSKAQAVAFMKDNTRADRRQYRGRGQPLHLQSRARRWPTRSGELKIERAARAGGKGSSGAKFDLRRFHDAVLGQGAVPLDALEAQIDAWIAAEKART